MNSYELMYIISSDTPEDKREELSGKIKSYIESKGGVVEGTDKLGMKKLAYPINFRNDGFYVLLNVKLPQPEVDAMSKLLNITEGVIRHLFVKKNA